MADATLDIVAMGDAIVDVIASCDDDFLVAHKLPRGSMQLLTPAAADELYAAMGPARETSGGSAANTMAGVAALGGRAGFVGQVADDQLGQIFRKQGQTARAQKEFEQTAKLSGSHSSEKTPNPPSIRDATNVERHDPSPQ